MKKSDLKSGMIIEERKGSLGIIINNHILYKQKDENSISNTSTLDDIRDDLTSSIASCFDIVKVTEIAEDRYLLPKNWKELFKIATKWSEPDKIEIKVTVNGKKVPLSTISEETLLEIRKNS